VNISVSVMVDTVARNFVFIDPKIIYQVLVVYIDARVNDCYYDRTGRLSLQQCRVNPFGADALDTISFRIPQKPICRHDLDGGGILNASRLCLKTVGKHRKQGEE